jgi:hypothetical protein
MDRFRGYFSSGCISLSTKNMKKLINRSASASWDMGRNNCGEVKRYLYMDSSCSRGQVLHIAMWLLTTGDVNSCTITCAWPRLYSVHVYSSVHSFIVLLARIDLIGRVSHVYLNLVPLSRNDIVFNKVGNANLLHAFLLLEAQRVYMGSGCNRLKTVARDIYNFIVGGLLNDYMMHRHLVLSVLCWLIFMNTLCDAWVVKNLRLCNQRLCALIDTEDIAMFPF